MREEWCIPLYLNARNNNWSVTERIQKKVDLRNATIPQSGKVFQATNVLIFCGPIKCKRGRKYRALYS